MKKALVGYTGFVGSNLDQQAVFQGRYNSKNMDDAFRNGFDLVVYSGIRAEKFLANQNPHKDREHIDQAINNIERLKMDHLVLISTIDVYQAPVGCDEMTSIDKRNLRAYGLNRYMLEEKIREKIPNHTIVRLPALYGEGLKKNFIFDMINIIPAMIKSDKFKVILAEKHCINLDDYYIFNDSGFYKLKALSNEQLMPLRSFFSSYTFNALSFTDSRNEYQFYPVSYLWQHIETALKKQLKLVCLNSEPVQAGKLYETVFNKTFVNECTNRPVTYDLKTVYAEAFQGKNGYIFDSGFILEDIKNFVLKRRTY